jgi:hypothetical protein
VADDERPAVGTVAEEAARLLDALGGWAGSTQTGYAARPAHGAASPDEGGPEEDGPEGDGPEGDGSPPSAGGHESRCETCGAENGVGRAVTCQLCPVCQGIGLLRSVRPETVDRLADLAGALAATLRDIASQRRDGAGADASRDGSPGGGSTASRRSRPDPRTTVQDIVVDDEDEHPGSATP